MEERREYLLALDGGTGSFRAILFQKDGVQKAIEQIEWEHPVYEEYPGSVGFDFEKNWEIIQCCIRNLIEKNNITCENIETGEINKKELLQQYNIPAIRFVGVIDRVDVLDKNISIIDYKSSQTDFTLDSIELGFISQILTYSLACELMFDKKSEDILGIFYREIAKLGKDLKTYRLRGLANSDLILKEDFLEIAPEVMYVRTTKKGAIHGADAHKAYTSPELEKLVNKNLHNVMILLEKIFSFDYSLNNYEVDNQYLAEKQTLFNLASNSDTRLDYKNKVSLKPKELKEKLLKE